MGGRRHPQGGPEKNQWNYEKCAYSMRRRRCASLSGTDVEFGGPQGRRFSTVLIHGFPAFKISWWEVGIDANNGYGI